MSEQECRRLEQVFSLIWGFISDLLYWIAIGAMVGGVIAYLLSYAVKILPMLGGYGLILQIGGILLTLGGGYYVTDIHGYNRRVAEDKAEIERLNSEARAKEAELNTKLNRATAQLKKAKNDIKTKTMSLNAMADAGELRLNATCGVQANSGASSVGGNPTDESDSERQTIKALIGIASEGDTAITSLNACIVQYNQVMQTVNGGVK
jgi:hypothetical protein